MRRFPRPMKLYRLPIMLAALAASACSPLAAFDALVPKDSGVQAIVKDAAFGTDPRQQLDVYRPKAAVAQRLPIIVFLYGGSWRSGTKSGYMFVGRALAAQGFVVAIPDYRLVPQVRYPAFIEDNAAAVAWVAAHAAQIGGDPQRLVIAGHSAGAYNAAMLAYDPRWLGAGQRRIRGFIGLAGPYDFLPFDGPITRAAFAGTKDLASTQPVNFIRRGDPRPFSRRGPKILLSARGTAIHLPSACAALERRSSAGPMRTLATLES
jgi:acetyl esterase/lipase